MAKYCQRIERLHDENICIYSKSSLVSLCGTVIEESRPIRLATIRIMQCVNSKCRNHAQVVRACSERCMDEERSSKIVVHSNDGAIRCNSCRNLMEELVPFRNTKGVRIIVANRLTYL